MHFVNSYKQLFLRTKTPLILKPLSCLAWPSVSYFAVLAVCILFIQTDKLVLEMV